MADESDFKPRYTVSSLTAEIASMLEPRFRRIFVDGEISTFRAAASGHVYFTLKDGGATIPAVMFKSALERCAVRDKLADGVKVLVCGRISLYAPQGRYQLSVMAVKLQGEGDLMQQYLALKSRLEGEGLFDRSRKRRLPFMPRRIGIVTSDRGAVIHDLCTVLTRRFPGIEIVLYPSLVQGDEAPKSIIAGIEYFNEHRPDVLIVARGGGSFEDLFCFNDEGLVRAVASSRVPTVSAVGHETDFTLCDFAADVRAGTPSIAAELVVPVKAELAGRVAELRGRLVTALQSRGQWYSQHLDNLSDAMFGALRRRHEVMATRVGGLNSRLKPAMEACYVRARSGYERLEAKLAALSPYAVLDRGYAMVTDGGGAIVRNAESVRAGDELRIRVANGQFSAVARTGLAGLSADE